MIQIKPTPSNDNSPSRTGESLNRRRCADRVESSFSIPDDAKARSFIEEGLEMIWTIIYLKSYDNKKEL